MTFVAGGTSCEGRTRNVSRGGLCANCSGAIPSGTDVEVDIVLVFDDGLQSEALRLPGRVAWCTPLEDEFQIGVSFLPMDQQHSEYLSAFLKFLGEERAQKAPRIDNVDEKFG